MEQPRVRERRRILIVNRPAQQRIIAAVVLVPSAALAVTSMVVAWFCRNLVMEALAADVALPSLTPLLVSVLGFCLIGCFVIAYRGLRFSHHVAGPAYRICKSLERLRAGDMDFQVKLREGDYLGEIAEEFNRYLEHLRTQRVGAIDATDLTAPSGASPQGTAEAVRPGPAANSPANTSIPAGAR
ncbi:MAG: hypothetical protein AB7I19_05100 [Planctomycetota bacterium]